MNIKKIFSIGLGFLKAKLLKKKAPLAVGWAITDKCNRKCPYCAIWKRENRDLSTEQVFEIIDALAEMGTIRISFTGGEPLLREDIGKIINHVHEKKIETKLNSNGALVKKRINELGNLDMMNLSLEGPEEIHDMIRGKGSFKEVIEAAEILKQNRININFATVMTSTNLDSIDDILDIAVQFNSRVMFQPATPLTLGGTEPNLLTPPEDKYGEAVQKLIQMKKDGNTSIGNSVDGLKHLAKWPHPEKIECASGWISCRIEPDGKVLYCSREEMPFTPKSCVDEGCRAAFSQLLPVSCDDCWCAARVELNLTFSGKLSVMFSQLKSLIS